ncbi:helix-turn-helix transcriptional regulator [Metabacillus idriensis]|uniref:helix-turn-helix transcriptional regulator n=1 Tax=Metabacillus idriensis TaxID=324768 RepID=UPI003D2E39B6
MKNRIRDLRSEKGLTQEQLSVEVGVSRQSIIAIETGKYNPSLELAFKIALTFQCKIEDVFIFDDGGEA